MSERPQARNETTETAPERVLLAAVTPRNDPDASTLDELEDLARTSGGVVVGRMEQRLDRPHPSTYLGKGKLAEVKATAAELEVDVVVVNHDLSPAQLRNVEQALEVRVVDRSELILDIFNRHARTKQARAQIELAALQYARPRLKRLWTHLSRIAGGVGTQGPSRGPGEKQIELDRRYIDTRIRDLQHRLKEIRTRKDREVDARSQRFDTVALVGYTNAGKSTLANRLTGAGLYAADRLFATLDTRTRAWTLPNGRKVLLSDSVGFLRRLPHHLIESFHATLSEAAHADLLLHLVDASHPDADRHVAAVESVLASLGLDDRPSLLVLNKVDRLADDDRPLLAGLGEGIQVSAATGAGVGALAGAVQGFFDAKRPHVRMTVPASQGKALAEIHRFGTIEREAYEGATVVLEVRIDAEHLGPIERLDDVRVERIDAAVMTAAEPDAIHEVDGLDETPERSAPVTRSAG